MADEFATPATTPSPGNEPSFSDFFQQYRKENPVQTTPFETKWHAAQSTDRYKESPIYSRWIDPFADNETAAAQAQSGWSALWNGTKGSWDGIKDGFASSAMVLPNLIGSIFKGNVEGMMDDEYGMRMSEYEQQQNQNENPIYMTEDERDDIFSMKAAGEMMQNAGYTIGTFAELAAETVAVEFVASVFTGATAGAGAGAQAAATAVEVGRWGKFMNNIRKAGTATGEAIRFGGKTAELAAQDAMRARTVAQQTEIISAMGKLRDAQFGSKLGEKLYNISTKIPVVGNLVEAGNTMSLASKTGLLTKGELAKIGIGGLRRAYGEFQAASGEAAIEAGGAFNEVYNDMYDDFVKNNGYEPDAEEDKRMRELAKNAAVDSYGLNVGTLLLMNKLEFGNIMRHMVPDNAIVRAFKNEVDDVITVSGKIGGKTVPQSFTKGTFGRLGLLPEIASTFDNGGRIAAAQFGKGLVAGFKQFSVWEGLQENVQEGIVHGLKKHYSDIYNNDPATWGEGFEEAVNSQLNKQGLKTFMMGAMTGVVTGPLINGAARGAGYLSDREAYRTQKDENEKTVAAFNTFMKNHANVLNEHIRKVKENVAYGEEMQRAAAADDQFNYLNSRESQLIQTVHSAKRLGNLPLLVDTVKAYGEGFDNQAFKEAFGFSPEDAGYSSAADFTSRIANDIQRYSDTYDHYMKKYSNFMDLGKYIKDPNRKLASDIARASLIDAIETVSFHENKAQDAVKRRAGIQSKISEYKTIGEALQSGFEQLTNLNEIENERDILINEIQSLDNLDVKSDETQRLIKIKNEQLEALQSWMDAIGYKMDETSRQYVYDNVAIRRKNSPERYKASDAFKRYLGARNAGLRRNQIVKQEEVDAAMQDVVDYMELGEENRKMVEALNTLNDPIAFNKTFQAAQNARIGAHARNIANQVRINAALNPVFARLVEENESLVAELETFAEAPYANNQNFTYLNELIKKLQLNLKSKKDKENNPETDVPPVRAENDEEGIVRDEEGKPSISPSALEPQNLQAMLDLSKDAQVIAYVNKHYLFKQIAGNRYSYQRVVDTGVKEPIVTHEGEFDISNQDSVDFAVAFETALFKKEAGPDPITKTVTKEAVKIKNLVGRNFTIADNQAVLEEESDGYYFRVFDPVSGETLADVFLGDDGEKSYRKFKYNGEKFDLIKEATDPVETAPGQSTPSTVTDSVASMNTQIQQIEDKKEEAIRDEKQKLEWNEGQRVMFEGQPGTIVKEGDSISDKKADIEKRRDEVRKAIKKAGQGEGGQFTVTLLDGTRENAVRISLVGNELGVGNKGKIVDLSSIKKIENPDGTIVYDAELAALESQYNVQLDNGSVIALGPGESLLDEYPGLTPVSQGATSIPEIVPVEDRVFAVEFTSDDRSMVNIDGKSFVIIRNESTGEIAGLQYQTKSGPRVGRNGIFQQYINAITTSYTELSEALAAEDQQALASDIEDLEANSMEIQTISQIMDNVPAEIFNKFVLNEPLSPEEVEALRNSFANVLTLKNESSVQGPLMDEMEYATLYNLNQLNAKYPPDTKPNDTVKKGKSPKQAKRRGKTQSKESNDDAGSSVGEKTKTPRKGKSKPTTLQESIEQLEQVFDNQKKEVRLSTDNANVQPVQAVEQYTTTLDTLVNDMLASAEDFTGMLDFVESSVKTTKKSTKNSKFVIGSTISQNDTNPFESLGEGITCNK